MPVTRSRTGLYDLDQTNTTRFLFGDEEEASAANESKHYQPANPDGGFPTLTRREGQPNMVSLLPSVRHHLQRTPTSSQTAVTGESREKKKCRR